MSDFDSPWKEALDQFFPSFVAYFFPEIDTGVDWSRGYESLDKELQQATHESEVGLRHADKVFRVWRHDGEETWVVIHVEVQSQADEEFSQRMFVYHYRLFDRFSRPVVSLAVLGDDRPFWRPREFYFELWGCRLRLEFPTVKLLDYNRDLSALEAETNPFGLIVLAHLQTIATRHDPAMRMGVKMRLIKGLLNRGLSAETIRQLFRLIDWMMDLPRDMEKTFGEEVSQYEKEKQMPHETDYERYLKERFKGQLLNEGEIRGLYEGIAFALENKFGPAGMELLPSLENVKDLMVLRGFKEAMRYAATLDEFRQRLASLAPQAN